PIRPNDSPWRPSSAAPINGSPASALKATAVTLNQRQGNWAELNREPSTGISHSGAAQVNATKTLASAPAIHTPISQRKCPAAGQIITTPATASKSAAKPS